MLAGTLQHHRHGNHQGPHALGILKCNPTGSGNGRIFRTPRDLRHTLGRNKDREQGYKSPGGMAVPLWVSDPCLVTDRGNQIIMQLFIYNFTKAASAFPTY